MHGWMNGRIDELENKWMDWWIVPISSFSVLGLWLQWYVSLGYLTNHWTHDFTELLHQSFQANIRPTGPQTPFYHLIFLVELVPLTSPHGQSLDIRSFLFPNLTKYPELSSYILFNPTPTHKFYISCTNNFVYLWGIIYVMNIWQWDFNDKENVHIWKMVTNRPHQIYFRKSG